MGSFNPSSFFHFPSSLKSISTFASETFASPYSARCGVGNGLPSTECGSFIMSRSASGSVQAWCMNIALCHARGASPFHSIATMSAMSFFAPSLSFLRQRHSASAHRASAMRDLSKSCLRASRSSFSASFQRPPMARTLPNSARGIAANCGFVPRSPASSIQRRCAAMLRSSIASRSCLVQPSR